MKIELEIKDEDFNNLICGLNNAIICYGDRICYVLFGLADTLPDKLAPLGDIDCDTLEARKKSLLNIYNQLLEIEKNQKKVGENT
jgi:hypothetical protein